MEDSMIVDLYWQRSEDAITETDRKYGRMLRVLASQLVPSDEDAAECVSDTYLAAWNSMPPQRPSVLGAFLSKITRRISVNVYRRRHAEKRGGYAELTNELSECVPSDFDLENALESRVLAKLLDQFVRELDAEKRYIFLRRYFYGDDLETIAKELSITVGKVKTVLHRQRKSLAKLLEKEGFAI